MPRKDIDNQLMSFLFYTDLFVFYQVVRWNYDVLFTNYYFLNAIYISISMIRMPVFVKERLGLAIGNYGGM